MTKKEKKAAQPSTVLATGVYFGRMTYADVATSQKVVRHYSCGSAERVYFYNNGYVRDAISRAEGAVPE